jgi:hypothetical protein
LWALHILRTGIVETVTNAECVGIIHTLKLSKYWVFRFLRHSMKENEGVARNHCMCQSKVREEEREAYSCDSEKCVEGADGVRRRPGRGDGV